MPSVDQPFIGEGSAANPRSKSALTLRRAIMVQSNQRVQRAVCNDRASRRESAKREVGSRSAFLPVPRMFGMIRIIDPKKNRRNAVKLLPTAAIALSVLAGLSLSDGASAQISDDAVKIGVLTDMSSLYSDATGTGSLIATQMAAEDFGGKVKGKAIEVIGADHQNKPDIGSTSGTTPARSMPLSMCPLPPSRSRCSRSPGTRTGSS